MKNLCENLCSMTAQNHVWRYTLCFFHTYAVFEQNRKIDAKRGTKSRRFWVKPKPWAPKGRLILPLGRFLKIRKIDVFPMSPWLVKKSSLGAARAAMLPKGGGSWCKEFQAGGEEGETPAAVIPEVRGTRGSLPEGTSQPDDAGGVGGFLM